MAGRRELGKENTNKGRGDIYIREEKALVRPLCLEKEETLKRPDVFLRRGK